MVFEERGTCGSRALTFIDHEQAKRVKVDIVVAFFHRGLILYRTEVWGRTYQPMFSHIKLFYETTHNRVDTHHHRRPQLGSRRIGGLLGVTERGQYDSRLMAGGRGHRVRTRRRFGGLRARQPQEESQRVHQWCNDVGILLQNSATRAPKGRRSALCLLWADFALKSGPKWPVGTTILHGLSGYNVPVETNIRNTLD